jgi:hypothetical protein
MEKFAYIPHDMYLNNHLEVIIETARHAKNPIITECPFAERILVEGLHQKLVKVIPYFVIERPEVVKARYEKRENKPISKSALTRASTILQRAIEWNAPYGTSQQILTKLQELSL